MKIKEIKIITEDGKEFPMTIPENCDVSLFHNTEKLNFEFGAAEYPFPKSYSAILIAPKYTNTEKIMDAIQNAIN